MLELPSQAWVFHMIEEIRRNDPDTELVWSGQLSLSLYERLLSRSKRWPLKDEEGRRNEPGSQDTAPARFAITRRRVRTIDVALLADHSMQAGEGRVIHRRRKEGERERA